MTPDKALIGMSAASWVAWPVTLVACCETDCCAWRRAPILVECGDSGALVCDGVWSANNFVQFESVR